MKKMIMMAVASLVVVSAGAQNKDFQKQMKAASAYQEALGVLNSNLSGLSAEDKALGYNRLVDLAMDKFNKENNIKLTNQVTQKNDPFDNDGMIEAAENALKAGMECDKFDQMPNSKGKVAPKFRKKNAERLLTARNLLLSAGQDLIRSMMQHRKPSVCSLTVVRIRCSLSLTSLLRAITHRLLTSQHSLPTTTTTSLQPATMLTSARTMLNMATKLWISRC